MGHTFFLLSILGSKFYWLAISEVPHWDPPVLLQVVIRTDPPREGPIASRGRSVRPSVKYVDKRLEKKRCYFALPPPPPAPIPRRNFLDPRMLFTQDQLRYIVHTSGRFQVLQVSHSKTQLLFSFFFYTSLIHVVHYIYSTFYVLWLR